MQVAFKTYFLKCKIWFKYILPKIKYIFLGDALEYTMIFML
jgi:hypothetical protein